MARLPFAAAALAVASAQWARRDWNSACGNPQCTRQGRVTGPQEVNVAAWVQTETTYNVIGAVGLVVEGGGARVAVAQEATCPTGGLCAAAAVYNASGTLLYEHEYDDVSPFSATYTYGVPAVAAYSTTGETGKSHSTRVHVDTRLSGAQPSALFTPAYFPFFSFLTNTVFAAVIVTGQGYHLDNGTYVSVLFGVAPLTGRVLWNTTTFDSLTGDVMPSGVGLHVYAIQGTSLLRVSATNGTVEWSVTLPGASSDPAAALARRVVLASDDSVAAVLDSTNGVVTGIDTTRANGLIMWQSSPASLPLNNCAHPAFDAGTGSLFIANGSSLVAFDLETGKLLFTVPYPDAVSTLKPGMAVDAFGRHVFIYTSEAVPGAPYSSGAPLIYGFDKITGALVGRYAFNGTLWSQWGSVLVTDVTGTILYTALLGPHLDSQPATAAAAQPAAVAAAPAAESVARSAARSLQNGGSVYITAVTFDAATGSFVSAIAPAPTALQAGFPTFALGPAPGQVSIASSNSLAVLTSTSA